MERKKGKFGIMKNIFIALFFFFEINLLAEIMDLIVVGNDAFIS